METDWTNWLTLVLMLATFGGAGYFIYRHRQAKKNRPKSGESYRDHKPSPPTQER